MKSLPNINQLLSQFKESNFVSGQNIYTYKCFFKRVFNISENLKSLGIKKGQVIIVRDVNPAETILLFFAIFHVKAIALPVNPKISDYDMTDIKKASRAVCVIANKDIREDAINVSRLFDSSNEQHAAAETMQWDYEIPALIILTSGSSGAPKMAVHSLASLFASAQAVNTYFNLKPGHNWMLTLPLYHVSGSAIVFRCLLSGAMLSVPDKTQDIIKSIEKFKPTHLSLVNTQLWRLLNNPLSTRLLKKVQAIFLGGSAIPNSLIKKCLDNNLTVFTSYGLTEVASTVAIKKIKDHSTDKAEILSSVSLKVSEQGEIMIRGDALFMGYYKKGKINQNLTAGGWFNTGDLGVLTKNQVTVTGRKDNMFISGGENIYPEEIEKHILMIDRIEKAVVVSASDKEFGQRPVAFIKKQGEISDDEINNNLKEYLSPFKIPDRYLPWPENYDNEDLKINRKYFQSLL